LLELKQMPAAFNFLGTLFTGAAADPMVSVAVAAGFFTGVALAADVAVFAGAVVVDPATLEMFPTLDWSAAFCCLSWSTADILE